MKRILMLSTMLLICVYALPIFTFSKNLSNSPENLKASETVEGLPAETPGSEASSAKPDSSIEITVLVNDTVLTMPLSKYLYGVVAAEMPASFPDEALKAQAVAARTYTMYKKRLVELGSKLPAEHKGALMCSNYKHCKAYVDIEASAAKLWGDNSETYQKKIMNAVDSTSAQIAVYKNEPIAAVFHSTSSSRTENAADVWGSDTPYLKSVESPGSESSPRYIGTVEISAEEFRSQFSAKYPAAKLDTPPSDWFKASDRSEAGGIITVAVGGVRVTGQSIRELFGLNSTNFTITCTSDSLTFHTIGYGHGVGLSQYGARELALEGKNYKEIIKWYYSGVEIAPIS